MSSYINFVKHELSSFFTNQGISKQSIVHILERIRRFQERIRKHIDDNYVDFMPNYTTSDMYIDEGESLIRETEHLMKELEDDSKLILTEAKMELSKCLDELTEVSLGLQVSYRILKIDDLFQCIEEANSTKDYLLVLDLLEKLKSLICMESSSNVDRLFCKCDCYDTIKVKYHIQTNILQQNLQQKFDRLLQLSEKDFLNAKNVTLQISNDTAQLQDTVMALFQARYNPMKFCDFLLEKCLLPIVQKPVSIELVKDNNDYVQLNISYSLKDLSKNLKPIYKKVFSNIMLLFESLSVINVNVFSKQHVFTIIGSHIKERLLKEIIDECLMVAIPETINDYQECTLIEDVLRFEQMLADMFFIDPDTDKALNDFTEKFPIYFRNRFHMNVLDNVREIIRKDLQDMVVVAEGNTPEEVTKNPFLFPQCMISKSTLDLVKLMERILNQSYTPEINNHDETDTQNFKTVLATIISVYITEVPKIHEKLLECIPQQSVLFYNNCMFLAHWIVKNAEIGIPTHPALQKSLQSTGMLSFKSQIAHQQKILNNILRDMDLSDPHSIGFVPMKLLRQCLRQMDVLKNVWLNVLPDKIYNQTFFEILDEFCVNIIKRIMSLEDISTTVANELSDLIEVTLDKIPLLFKDSFQVVHITNWMKLKHLKIILNSSLQEIIELWCDGAGILTANYKAEEVHHLIRALFQNTDRRSKAISTIT